MTLDTGKTTGAFFCVPQVYTCNNPQRLCSCSFVAGSDGFIYEGRGWRWQGAHTLGHNSKGYGVSFIGDYSARLPSQHSMELVRDQLASCAVGGGRLATSFTVQGHRQVVNTACPGDALYREIQGWERFGVCRNARWCCGGKNTWRKKN